MFSNKHTSFLKYSSNRWLQSWKRTSSYCGSCRRCRMSCCLLLSEELSCTLCWDHSALSAFTISSSCLSSYRCTMRLLVMTPLQMCSLKQRKIRRYCYGSDFSLCNRVWLLENV